jgi:hypothetical protein
MNALAVERSVERGIKRPIPASDLLIHDGTNFPGPRVHRILPTLVADFIREAHAHGPVPFLRYGNSRPDMISHPLPALTFSYGSEDVKATFKPVIEAVSDLHRFMLGVIGWVNTINDCFRTVDREIAVELNHRVSGIDQIRSVHLDFVVVLSTGESCSQDQGEEQKRDREMSATHRLSGVTTAPEEDYQLHNELGVAIT